MLEYHFNWQQPWAMAGIAFYRFSFPLFRERSRDRKSSSSCTRWVGTCAVQVIWDGRPDHRSQVMRDNVESLKGAIQLEYLPAYTPELNATEYT
jgi:hypothetical protein